MAFVGGLMGPYMRPIPIGASSAMVFSLFVAFAVSPWTALILLKKRASEDNVEHAESRLTRLYRKGMATLIGSRRNSGLFFAAPFVLLIAAILFVPLKWVKVKMLPFDNKSEFQVILDMPKGTSLERTAAVAQQMRDYLRSNGRDLEFRVDADTHDMVITVREAASGKVIRQIPNEEALQMRRYLDEWSGTFLNVTT